MSKIYNSNILKRNLILIGALVNTVVSATGCSFNYSKTKEEIYEEVFKTYSICDDIRLEDNNGEYVPFMCIENGIYDKETLKQLNEDQDINYYGLIVCPSDITYESIYKDIDLVKDIVSNNTIKAPILYDIDYLKDAEYDVANIRLAEAFIDKLTANGISTGLYGTTESINHFVEKYDEFCLDTKFEINASNIFSINSQDETVDLSEKIDYINENKLNNPNKFVSDYTYIIKKDDNLSLICELYNIKLDDLVGYNNISKDELLIAGNTLKIPNVYFKQNEVIEEYYSFDECSIGIDVSEYNCKTTGEKRINEELTQEIVDNFGYGDLIRYSLGIEPNEYDSNENVFFKEDIYQHLDWDDIGSKVDFVAIRIGDFWISKDDKIVFDEDEEFRYNINNCIEKNIPYFTYYVTDATNKYSAIEETKIIMNLLTSIDPDYSQPIYMDIEPYTDLGKNIYEYDKNSITTIDTSLSMLINNGFNVGIYSTDDICDVINNIDELKKYSLWSTCSATYDELINYTSSEIGNKMKTYGYYPSNITNIIQLTCNGKSYIIPKSVEGTFGSMDIDIASKSFVKKLSK